MRVECRSHLYCYQCMEVRLTSEDLPGAESLWVVPRGHHNLVKLDFSNILTGQRHHELYNFYHQQLDFFE